MSNEVARMSGKKKQQALVPRLRFPEFRAAAPWVNGRCGDIADVLQGYGFPERYQGEARGLYPFYKVSDISAAFERGQKYIVEANNYIEEDVLSEIGAKPVPEGTTIFAKIGEAIRSNRRVIATRPSVIDNNVAGVKARSGKASDEFLYYLWSNVSLIDFAGGVVPAISKTAIETIPVAYTQMEAEQQKIADCLGSLDDLIAAEGRKLAALRDHKKGLMQQLFPREGETRPRLRFPEFSDAGEWEEGLIEEFFLVGSSKRVLQQDWTTEGVPFYRTRELVSLSRNEPFSSEVFISEDFFSEISEKYGVPDNGDFLVSGVGTLGISYQVRAGDRFYFKDGNVLWLKLTGDLISDFFKYCFQSDLIQDQISGQASVSTVGTYTIQNAKKTRFLRPVETKEQQRIADCLSALDALIAAQAAKLDTLHTHKRGLMQQLFPSPEEVGV